MIPSNKISNQVKVSNNNLVYSVNSNGKIGIESKQKRMDDLTFTGLNHEQVNYVFKTSAKKLKVVGGYCLFKINRRY